MADNTKKSVVFITGANRGIGKALLEKFLALPNHIVIGSVRDAASSKHESLKASTAADGSKLLLVSIESASHTDPKKAVAAIQQEGIEHIDLVIANAGVDPPKAKPENIDLQKFNETLQINTLGPLVLYQATKPLLDKASRPRWVTVSSIAGSIGGMLASDLPIDKSAFAAYGATKAAVNYLTASIHLANPKWITTAIHPGWIDTDMGSAGAKDMGLDKTPQTVAKFLEGFSKFLDNANPENASGKFIDVITGDQVPW